MSSFFDSNILLYFASGEAAKAARAEEILREGGWISVQVLNETARILAAKWRFSWDETRLVLRRCEELLEVVPVTMAVHRVGLDVAQRYRLSLFDSMIVAAALLRECEVLYSEDMHHGLVVERQLTIINPFRDLSA